MARTLPKFLTIGLLVLGFAVVANVASGANVAVIAPTASTRAEARAALARLGYEETSLDAATAILVVVRSGTLNPLSVSYDAIKDLQSAAEMQANASGINFHVYIYSVNSSAVSQISHRSYKAQE
jgi:cell division GTPase FtsZ